jgi:hypothetical protein
MQSFNDVLGIHDTQECADLFYTVANSILDKFYPCRSITISDCDPPFITPELKGMLREKNRLMRAGKVNCADAMAIKIGKAIVKYNSTRLSHIDPRSGVKDLWTEVTRLIKPASLKGTCFPSTYTAQTLNDHYASISNDSNYTCPPLKPTTLYPCDRISEREIFYLLDKLRPTASGLDGLPFWFLRVGAPIFCLPLSHLFNISIASSTVPTQWKTAVIHPIPKIATPKLLTDMRPISVLPILSRSLERLVVRNYLNPALSKLPSSLSIANQFAYRPTGSTTAALVALLAHISNLLVDHQHVFVITFDYSKAFDTLRHSSVASKLSLLDLPSSIYNWVLDFLSNRSHCTSFKDKLSSPASISASIVQGSVLGPTLFNLNSCDLSPVSSHNRYFKYADDAYLVVPFSNVLSIQAELDHHSQWAGQCNLKLNPAKTSEIVFSRKGLQSPPINPGITRLQTTKILGVIVDNRLTFTDHVDSVVTKCNQSLFALRLMRQHGMSQQSLQSVFKATSIPKLLYASPSWWGFTSRVTMDRIEAFFRRAKKFGFYSKGEVDAKSLCEAADKTLFRCVTGNEAHALQPYMPPLKSFTYALRKRGHNFELPRKDDRNFINRMLFSNTY